jgi:hypothetical protein
VTHATELSRDDVHVVRSAPRYDPRIDALVVELDDIGEPMAEICRRVSAAAEQLGLTRPSLVHLRTLVRAERDRKEAARARREDLHEIAEDVVGTLAIGRVPNAYVVADRIEDAGRRAGT